MISGCDSEFSNDNCSEEVNMSHSLSFYDSLKSWFFQPNFDDIVDKKVFNLKIEKVLMLEKYNKKNPSQGDLFLTTTNLAFVDIHEKKETWILFSHISNIEKLAVTSMGSSLQIQCKTFLSVTFVIPIERDCHNLYQSLLRLYQPSSIENLFCFNYNSQKLSTSKQVGWNYFSIDKEYQRMNLPNNHWTVTNINQNYEICDTYPRILYVPTSATKSVLLGSSHFRSKGRFPVLAYLYKNQAAICRCSQPLSGFKARCCEDEQLLNCIFNSNPNATFTYVVDTRPKINAMANRATGKGYESESFYDNIKFYFFGIENIHVMRSSLQKVIETRDVKNATMSTFLSGLESSGWLRHIKIILETSQFVTSAIYRGHNVIVHCSDGWDRTAQVCSLSQLLLDPYYRTIRGFQALIEKDWLSFGHKFNDRYGHVQVDSKEISPIFTQFLDCTWQLMQQFPLTFEFNELFLFTLHDHVTSCKFGTFIGNCEKDRIDLKLSKKTYSLWEYIANHYDEYKNPLYAPDDEYDILEPDLSAPNIRFWRGMYCRFENGVHPRVLFDDILLSTLDHSMSLRNYSKYLTKTIESIKGHLMKLKTDGNSQKKAITESISTEEIQNNKKQADQDNIKFEVENLVDDFCNIAIDWKSSKNLTECQCSTQFDYVRKKYHCWKCGNVYCVRCIKKHVIEEGYFSKRSVPVCDNCCNKVLETK